MDVSKLSAYNGVLARKMKRFFFYHCIYAGGQKINSEALCKKRLYKS